MKVVFAVRGDGYAAYLAERMEEAGIALVRAEPGDAFRRELADADVAICNRLEPADTEAATRLRLVQALSAGADGVDASALPPGCALCNLYEHEDAVAEWALMGILAVSRHLLVYDRRLRQGDWSPGLPMERELRGRTLGTIGYGHIGRRVVELAAAFGMDAAAVTRAPAAERAAGLRWLGGLEDVGRLMRESDVAVVAVPLTDGTRGLLGAAELDLLGPDGILVNVARGDIVEEQALYEALRDRRIAGAALDVWYRYPRRGEHGHPSELPFHELDNVVMTPHVSGRSEGTRVRRARFLVEQVRRLEEGRPLENVVAVGPPR